MAFLNQNKALPVPRIAQVSLLCLFRTEEPADAIEAPDMIGE
jgi:hypothetical protein